MLLRGRGLKECQRASWGDRVNFIVTQPKCSNPPPPVIKNDQFPKGLTLLQFFESYVTFEECKYNFFGNKRSTIDTKFALISQRQNIFSFTKFFRYLCPGCLFTLLKKIRFPGVYVLKENQKKNMGFYVSADERLKNNDNVLHSK